MRICTLLAIVSIASALGGCASAPSKVNAIAPNSSYVVDLDASRRAIDILPRTDGKGVTVCAEPAPDVAMQVSSQILASVAAQNPSLSASLQVQFSNAVVQLAGRTQLVLVLRESLYRICEQAIDEKLTSEQTMELYRDAMQTTLMLAKSDLAKNNADLAKSLEDPEVRKTWNQANGNGATAAAPAPAAPASKTSP